MSTLAWRGGADGGPPALCDLHAQLPTLVLQSMSVSAFTPLLIIEPRVPFSLSQRERDPVTSLYQALLGCLTSELWLEGLGSHHRILGCIRLKKKKGSAH